MAQVEVKKIFLAATLSRKEKILDLLQELGCVEIKEIAPALKSAEVKTAEIEKNLNRFEALFDSLKEYQKKDFLTSLIGEQLEISEKEFRQICGSFNYPEVLNRAEHILNALARHKEQSLAFEDELGDLEPWAGLNVPLNLLNKEDEVIFWPLVVARRNLEKFKKVLEPIKLVHFEIVKMESGQVLGFLAGHKKIREQIEKLFSQLEINIASLPEIEKTPTEAIKNLELELKNNLKEIENLKKALLKMEGEFRQLKIYYDYLLQQKIKLEAENKIGRTQATFIIEGWVRGDQIEFLREKISQVTSQFELIEAPILKKETAPVVLENKKIIRPFEIVTKMYGSPAPTEIDPTPILSIFFVVFFGICLGDAGYGIILMLLASFLLKKIKLPQGGRDILKLLFYGGISSMVAGTLLGSWFGLNLQTIYLPGFLRNLLLRLQILDIFKNPLYLLFFSFFLGLVQIFTGLGVALYNSLKNEDYQTAFLDNVSWLCFLSGLVFFALYKFFKIAWLKPTGYFTLFWAAFLVLTQGRHQKNIFSRLGSGLLSLYKTSGYLGDMLSYSRLLALGMCSAVIAMVVNILAGLAKNNLPFVGLILAGIIFLLGHFFNLILSILSAFIHSLRLQLVEFFGKFFQGGGRFLKPFKRETKFSKIF